MLALDPLVPLAARVIARAAESCSRVAVSRMTISPLVSVMLCEYDCPVRASKITVVATWR